MVPAPPNHALQRTALARPLVFGLSSAGLSLSLEALGPEHATFSPPMKRFLFALFSILGLSSARAADIITTHHFGYANGRTVFRFAREGNVVITASGLGWPGIVALNAAVVVGISFCTLYWWRRPLRYASVAGRDDPWSLASFNYFGRVFSPAAFLWRLSVSWPKNWRMFAQFVGVVAPSLLMAASAMAVFSWFALHQWHWAAYQALYRQLFPGFPYALLVPVYGGLVAGFYRSEWRRFHASLPAA